MWAILRTWNNMLIHFFCLKFSPLLSMIYRSIDDFGVICRILPFSRPADSSSLSQMNSKRSQVLSPLRSSRDRSRSQLPMPIIKWYSAERSSRTKSQLHLIGFNSQQLRLKNRTGNIESSSYWNEIAANEILSFTRYRPSWHVAKGKQSINLNKKCSIIQNHLSSVFYL